MESLSNATSVAELQDTPETVGWQRERTTEELQGFIAARRDRLGEIDLDLDELLGNV